MEPSRPPQGHVTFASHTPYPTVVEMPEEQHYLPQQQPTSPPRPRVHLDGDGFSPYNPADFEDNRREYSAYQQQTEPTSPWPHHDPALPVRPPMPSAPKDTFYSPHSMADSDGSRMDSAAYQQQSTASQPPYNPQDYQVQGSRDAGAPSEPQQFLPPPKRADLNSHDVSSPVHYTRDPHKLVAYLVPFPKPHLKGIAPENIPERFLIYTPPPPPLSKPKEGEKESKVHKIQRKWEEEVRSAKTSDAKLASWKGAKSRATKGINWAMAQTKNSNIEFLNRVGGGQEQQPKAGDDETYGQMASRSAPKLEEMVLVYPPSMGEDQNKMREEFVNTMFRTKSKAERDAIIATGLLPVSLAVDVLATLVWPFGGLFEIDAVWLYGNFRGAKTSRSVTSRLSTTGGHEDKLHLNLTPSRHITALQHYLAARCHERNPRDFPAEVSPPTETQVLEAIGWSPSQNGGETRNWEDEQWEVSEVKDDLRNMMQKGAKEWDKWIKMYQKDSAKAMTK